MNLQRVALVSAGLMLGGGAVFAVTPFGRDLMFHVVPPGWTGEADRLAAALQVRKGSVVADIGAGNGALIVELAQLVGPQGHAYASEVTPEQRRQIEKRSRGAGLTVTTIAAADSSTNLPNACCDAITMRMVMHHVSDPAAFARDLRRAIRPGGRVGIIDFAPGALPHLAGDHGVPIDAVLSNFAAAGFDVASRHDDWGGRTYLIVFTPR
jgi:SAM-dependent methyltransferase